MAAIRVAEATPSISWRRSREKKVMGQFSGILEGRSACRGSPVETVGREAEMGEKGGGEVDDGARLVAPNAGRETTAGEHEDR